MCSKEKSVFGFHKLFRKMEIYPPPYVKEITFILLSKRNVSPRDRNDKCLLALIDNTVCVYVGWMPGCCSFKSCLTKSTHFDHRAI